MTQHFFNVATWLFSKVFFNVADEASVDSALASCLQSPRWFPLFLRSYLVPSLPSAYLLSFLASCLPCFPALRLRAAQCHINLSLFLRTYLHAGFPFNFTFTMQLLLLLFPFNFNFTMLLLFLFTMQLLLLLLFVVKCGSAGAVPAAQGSSDDEEADQPRSGADEVKAIFLSHSGKQKSFVEHLYNALQRANHTAFFDKHTLPKGSRFPPHINRAARGCKLGVVVLSDDFLTSKWPMRELEMLVQQRGFDAMVLPLFYKLHPRDLKSPENLSKWRRMWKEKARGDQQADKWERAVKALDGFNGEIFSQETSETAYIERVVRSICNLVPSHASYDLSPIQGRQRLAKEVARQFEHADARQCEKARMVGLHGLGGLGKTTMCKNMVNFYNSEYPGRSHLLEFPTDGNDKLKIVQECKKALKKLANLSNERLLNEADSFDQVVQLMRDHLSQCDVFLAIDNVWESSREAAERILGVSFSANSKILLTSRSEQVLKDLLRGHSDTSVCPLPAPEHEEALQIFQETFKLGDLNSLVNRNQLDRVLERCKFSGTYHALALKALSKHVNSVCVLEGLVNIENILEEIISNADLLNVEDVIRLNYESLPEHKKHMFLDIAVLSPFMIRDEELTYANACQWLSFLYKEFPKIEIKRLIYELALDGLIQLEERDGDAKKIIRVHDLFSELAHREAASSSRFFTERSNKLVEEIEWEKLERVILRRGDENPRFIEKLQQQECRKLQVLYIIATGREGIHLDLDCMPSLCVLNLQEVTLRRIENWTAATGLAIIVLLRLKCVQPLEPIPSMPSLERLTIDNVQTVGGPPNLDGCQSLKQLVLIEAILFDGSQSQLLQLIRNRELLQNEGSSYFNSLTNLESLHIEYYSNSILNLNALVQLQRLHVQRCNSIQRIEGLDALKNLQRLDVWGCRCLENLDGLSGLLQLKDVGVKECRRLEQMPDLCGLTRLKTLVLNRNDSMEEVRGLSSTLQDVRVTDCGALKKMPDLSSLTRLETLLLYSNRSIKEVGGDLSSTLKDVIVGKCRALKKMPDVSGLTCLEKLVLDWNESMEEVGGQYLSSTLKYLRINNCQTVRSFPSLNNNLQSLSLLAASAHVINMVSSDKWKGPTLLQYLRIEKCDSINKLDLSLLTNLKCLMVRHCKALEEIAGLSALQSLEDLQLCNCQRLKKVGGFMSLSDCGSLKESTIPDKSLLRNIHIEGCGELKEMKVGIKCHHYMWVGM